MTRVLIGGDEQGCRQLERWLASWGLHAVRLAPGQDPASVSSIEASAVIYVGAMAAASTDVASPPDSAAPLVLVGRTEDAGLSGRAWEHVPDPGPAGHNLAAALRPCLDPTYHLPRGGADFRDFLNHELRTPLTAAGMALQTLALHLEPAGGRALELLDTALRNIERLEQTVEWTTDYVVDPAVDDDPDAPGATFMDLLVDLDATELAAPWRWSTETGDWDVITSLSRGQWRRLLRQVHRALAFLQLDGDVVLRLSLDEDATSLMMVFELPRGTQRGDLAATGEEQLRRLLAFTVHPELARSLKLRHDVVCSGEVLRLRLLLPDVAAAPELALQEA